MTDFKAYGTRLIKKCMGNESAMERYWTQHGSTKYLWTKQALVSAIGYVKNEQGQMMEFGLSEWHGAPNVSEGQEPRADAWGSVYRVNDLRRSDVKQQ